MNLADQNRQYVFLKIKAANQEGRKFLTITSAEIHDALGLENRFPAVCGALDAKKFRDSSLVKTINHRGPKQSSTAEWKIQIQLKT